MSEGSTLTLVLGGARSGKSTFAEHLLEREQGQLLYLATGSATDPEMAARIDVHRRRRGDRWTTDETDRALVAALRAAPEQPILVDSLGTWLSAHDDFLVDVDELVEALRGRDAPTVVVSEEVGLGVHPSTDIGRRFRDALGTVNQAVAAAAGSVWLVVAGCGLRLETGSTGR